MKSDSKRVTITKEENKMSVPALEWWHVPTGPTLGEDRRPRPQSSGSHSEIKLSQVYLEISCLKITKLPLQEEIKTSTDSASNRAGQEVKG